MIGRQARLARDGLDDRQPVQLDEAPELGLRERVVDAAARDDERPLRRPERCGGRGQFVRVRPLAAERVHPRLEQPLRVVVGDRLHVLGEPDEGRAALRRVEHRLERERQRLGDLGGVDDPVPVARDRPERVVDRRRGRAEMLHLLQHGIRDPALERVPREQQQRQPVRHRDAGRRHHVQRAGPDRRGGDHDLAPAHRLREADRRQRHPLLVLAPERRQLVARLVEGEAEPGDVAVAEDREDAGEERHLAAVDLRPLGDQEPHDRLRGRQPHRLHRGPSAVVIGQRGSAGMSSQVARIQAYAGSSTIAIVRSGFGPAITLR